MSEFATVAVLSLAGAVGCVLRGAVRDALQRRGIAAWRTIAGVNLLGALAMGLASGGGAPLAGAPGATAATAATGLLAGWTTYSAFSVDVVQLWLRGDRHRSASLWAVTILGAPAIAWVGGMLAQRLAGGAA